MKKFSIFNFQFSTQTGFTLIELLVVMMILGILLLSATLLFNPLAQLQKAHNATREQDLNQIKNALDTYYNDNGCYPTSLSFGNKWSSGTTVYMQKIPQDPDCSSSDPTYCYDYQTDGTTCPQWNILYATMHKPIATSIGTCPLATMDGCLPTGGIFTYNYCTISGKLDCTYLSTNSLPTPVPPGGGGSGGGGTGGGGGGTTPTPIPTTICNGPLSACSNGVCDTEGPSNCAGCGGSLQCFSGLTCGGNPSCR